MTVTITKVKAFNPLWGKKTDQWIVTKKTDRRIIRTSQPLGREAAESLAKSWSEE